MNDLKLYNSLTKQKEILKPLEPGKIKLYACGMTVYDDCHIGHVRMMFVFDIVVRFLRELGYQVDYVQNITDIDDKIIQKAQQQRQSWLTITQRYIQSMHEDRQALGLLPPDHEPKATDNIAAMIDMIKSLLEQGYAYQADNGDVLYRVSACPDYGKLSHADLQELRSGSRVEVSQDKEDPLDFVLWKMAKPDEPAWSSPWGQGRPGWHIECSAMTKALLGECIDIHGGGMDLKFPHHENEIAQSEVLTCQPMANIWMHVGFLQMGEEKMSKSLGNFLYVKDIVNQHHPETIRYLMLASHYRQPVNYTNEALQRAQDNMQRFYLALRPFEYQQLSRLKGDADTIKRFNRYLKDDLNTPQAFTVLHELVKLVNKYVDTDQDKACHYAATLYHLGCILGFFQQQPETFLRQQGSANASELTDQQIETKIAQRHQARLNKDFATADAIRDELAEQGIILEDKGQQTTWRRQ